MRFRSLNLTDFGCFQLSQMRSIEDGLVVIGGPQRAGKTTFMQAVRQLGPWGVKRGNDLPPAADEYRLSAEFEYEGSPFTLTVNGHATPSLASTDGDLDIDLEDIFRDITRTQYEQVYTISLDELKRLPDGINSREDLSEVLLGAAYGDVAVIPQLEDEFDDRANEIGRTFGKATETSLLRRPMDTIEAGIELRNEALGQIETYHETHGRYTELREEIAELDSDIDRLERKRQRLSVLESEFDDVRRYQSLGREIAESDIERAESLPDGALRDAEGLEENLEDVHSAVDDARSAFGDEVDTASIEKCQEALLDHEEEINEYQGELSGWRRQLEHLQEERGRLNDRRDELKSAVEGIHESWTGEFEPVKSIKTDLIHRDKLEEAVKTFTNADNKLEDARVELEEKKLALEESEERLEELRNQPRTSKTGKLAISAMVAAGMLAVIAAVAGGELGYPTVGLAVAVAALAVGAIFASRKIGSASGSAHPIEEERVHRNQLQHDITDLEATIETQASRRDGAATAIAEAKATLGIPDDVSPDATWDVYENVVDLQKEISSLESQEEELAKSTKKFEATTEEVSTTVSGLVEVSWDQEHPAQDAEAVFEAVGRAHKHLELAIDLQGEQLELQSIREDIDELLNAWPDFELPDSIDGTESDHEERLGAFIEQATWASDLIDKVDEHEELEESLKDRFETKAVREAFEEVHDGDDKDWLTVLEREAEEFVDRDEVEDHLNATRDDIDEYRDDLKDLNKQQNGLEGKLADLKSDDDIVEARRQISEGRAELRRLGEEYAVNRLAEHLTERLHERFLEEMAGPLIDEASEIFSEITQEYAGIAHTDQLDDLNFEALRGDKPAHETGELSRATTEQLFLAVRLARIRQLETSLPVVIDDSMTNFDPAHGARAVQTINELASTNQVFFLTCHPEQVALLDDYSDVSQYWCLEHGSFDGPHEESDPVYELLHVSGSAQA